MDIEIVEIDSCNKKIKFVIPHKKYKQEVGKYYKKLGRQVKVPGFRKGKVPESLLEKQFGPEVKKEVLSKLKSVRKILWKEKRSDLELEDALKKKFGFFRN